MATELRMDVNEVMQAERKAIRDILTPLCQQLAASIQEASPIATGSLSGSFVVSSRIGEEVILQVGSPLWGKPTGYGMYPEFGTKPHWAPIVPLLEYVTAISNKAQTQRIWKTKRREMIKTASRGRSYWVKTKTGESVLKFSKPIKLKAGGKYWQSIGGGRRRLSTYGGGKFDYDRELMARARAIQWAIHLRGTKAQRYVERVLDTYGLPHREVHTGQESYYSVDATQYILDNNLVQVMQGYLK